MLLFDPQLHTYYVAKGSDQSSPLPALIAVVFESILEVFVLCLVGWYLAKRGIINAPAKKTLNKINTSLFNPALLFNKVAFSLTPSTLAELYIIPIGFVLITCFSAAVAYSLGTLFRLQRGQRNFAIACAMFQNSNSLPIALVQSLLSEKLKLSWGPHDTKDAMLGRALSYLVLFSTLGIIVRWSIGVQLVSSAEQGVELHGDEHERDEDMRRLEHDEENDLARRSERDDEEDLESSTTLRPESSEEEQSPQPALKPKRSILKDASSTGHERSTSNPTKFVLLNETSPDPAVASSNGRGLRREPSLRKKKARIFQSFPNTPAHSVGGSRASSVYGVPDYEDEDGENLTNLQRAGRTLNRRVWQPTKRVGRKIGSFMTVPLWAALLSLVVACIPPLQHTLNKAEPIKAAIRSAGACSVPVTLITLGAYFYVPSEPATTSMLQTPESPDVLASSSGQARTDTEPRAHALRKSFSTQLLERLKSPFSRSTTSLSSAARRENSGANRTIIVAVLSRMIIVPLALVPLFGYYAYKTVNRADDPVFCVVACLLIGSPTAITLAQITSASNSAAAFEKLISRTLFVSYAFLTAPTTVALVLAALYIDKLQNPPPQ
ncbi:uncharacterized protein JCM15063_006475 [Sporobolomyces koalae]|uniref:uncharacterized protein n=1 Tax=Sporobolomyces koalae TaxID=500713 RepID=UPI00317AB7CB